MRQPEPAFHAEIHHEGRARELLPRDLAIGPATPQSIGDQARHGASKVGVDHDGPGPLDAGRRPNANRSPALKNDLLHRLVKPDLHAKTLRDTRHRRRHRRATADRMKYPVFVLNKGKNRKEARTAKRRHPEILRLKRKREPHALITKEAFQIGIQRLMGTQHGKHLQQTLVEQIPPSKERSLQTGLHAPELGAILIDKTTESRRVARNDRRNLPLHAPEIRCRIQLATLAENDPIVGIEPDKVDLVAQARSRRAQDFVKHTRVEKKRRTQIESEPVSLNRRRPAAQDRTPLKHCNLQPGTGKQDGRGQTSRTSSDYDHGRVHDGRCLFCLATV